MQVFHFDIYEKLLLSLSSLSLSSLVSAMLQCLIYSLDAQCNRLSIEKQQREETSTYKNAEQNTNAKCITREQVCSLMKSFSFMADDTLSKGVFKMWIIFGSPHLSRKRWTAFIISMNSYRKLGQSVRTIWGQPKIIHYLDSPFESVRVSRKTSNLNGTRKYGINDDGLTHDDDRVALMMMTMRACVPRRCNAYLRRAV